MGFEPFNSCVRWTLACRQSRWRQLHIIPNPFTSYLLLCQFNYRAHFLHDLLIILPAVRFQTTGTILDPVFRIGKAASATVTQRIQRTIAEQAAKGVPVCAFVAGKIFTLPILEKFIMLHFFTPLSTDKFPAADERIPSFLPFSDV